MDSGDQDIAWLLRNQASLDRRLERIENSLIFRTLRGVGRAYAKLRPAADDGHGYRAWRKRNGNLPAPIAQPSGDYIFFGNPAPEILSYFAAHEPADAIYADEEFLNPRGLPARPLFKPAWSPILFRSVNYLGPQVAVRRQFLENHADMEGALRATPHARVAHIPAILYSSPERALPPATLTQAPPHTGALVSAIVCTRTAALLEACLRGLRERTDRGELEIIVVHHLGSSSPAEESAVQSVIGAHSARRVPFPGAFHFAAMNNLGAAAANGSLLLFLNDDVTPLKPDWLRRLTHWLGDAAVGAAGARLTFPDGSPQHTGIAASGIEGAWHPGRSGPPSALWPWNRYTREVSAVTGACLAMRAGDFYRLGGFDAAFPVNFNDVDLCFRLQREGLSIVLDVEAELEHNESRTRATGTSYDERRIFYNKWASRLEKADPFYSPFLAQNTEEILLR